MAIDWLGHGLLLHKCIEEPGIFEVNARRFIAFDRKSLEYMVKYSVKRLQSEFPDYEIEVKLYGTINENVTVNFDIAPQTSNYIDNQDQTTTTSPFITLPMIFAIMIVVRMRKNM